MKNLFSILTVLLLAIIPALAQDQITIDWIYNKERMEQFSIPNYQWLEDGSLIILNKRESADQRRFQKYYPQSNRLIAYTDMKKAIQSLSDLTGNDSTKVLDWPVEIDPKGNYAVYHFDKDLFLLDFTAALFRKLTDTTEPEKAPNFSPDGNYLAYVFKNDLYIYNIPNNTTDQLTTDGSETILNGNLSWVYWEEIFGRKNIAYWWSGDSKNIAFLRTDETGVGIVHFLDFKPQTPRLIKQPYPKAGTQNPEVTVHIIDIQNKKISPVDFRNHNYEYITRVQWLPDNQQLSIQTMNRAQTEVNLFFCDKNGNSLKHILTETDTAWVNIHDDLTFLPDKKRFLWTSERDGYAHIYCYRMDGSMVNRITQGEWSLRSSGSPYWLRQSVLGYDVKTDFVYFIAQEKSPLERHLYRIRPDGSNMLRLTKQDGTHRIGMSPDFTYYMDTFSNSTTPPALICYKTGTGKGQKIVKSKSDDIKKFNIQYPETFKIKTSDGFPLPAQILKPADFDPGKKYPLIFYVYGGPSAPTVANAWRSDLYYEQILLQNGYIVARIDPRSATAINKTLENRIVKMVSGPLELKDLIDAVNWFKSQPFIDKNRVGVWGWSGGGSFTLNAMTHSDAFKAGISVAPVTDWHYYDTIWAEFGMKSPVDNPEGYKVTSTVLSAKNLHGRLLLVHGTYDDNVHPQNSWHFIDELINAGKMFEMMFYPMRKHGIRDLPARRHLYKTMLEFWKRNL
jgi:dipeptidyl-peptidase-4